MRRKNILIIVLAIIASACQTTSRTKEISLGTSINLYGDAKEIGVDLYRPSKMYILDCVSGRACGKKKCVRLSFIAFSKS